MGVKITQTKNIEKLIKKIANQKQESLLVGFLTSEQATIAAKNEFGGVYPASTDYKDRAKAKGITVGDTVSIPPRPFMRTTFEREHNNWTEKTAKLLKKTDDSNKTLQLMGFVVRDDIKATIIDANSLFLPNSPKTIAIKNKNTVLRDSGEMLNSVEFAIVGSK